MTVFGCFENKDDDDKGYDVGLMYKLHRLSLGFLI